MNVEKHLDTSDVGPDGRRLSTFEDHKRGSQFDPENAEIIVDDVHKLKRNLTGRHMQMIAIGGAIGAGLFVGSGSALRAGGPGSLGFAIGWDYAIGWLTILPFEITAAGITIEYWRDDLNIGIWIAVFLVALSLIQIFGVRGYGEVEFVLSMVKIAACTGFILFGIIDNCGGVPTDSRGYIGARYWHDPGAFANGFKGFCSVFVTASFAFGGTELTGLAAAEAADPRKQVPKATKQVFWRITFFYVVNLFILGLLVPANAEILLGSSGANTKYSPFVYAIKIAGVKGLPSVFNAVITISVISVANSATYASTRTIQALAMNGMAPKFLAYVDKRGRPVPTILLQIAFGFLAFANEATNAGDVLFTWLLALSGLANFFIWASICICHIRFRMAWKRKGHSVDELPFKAAFGIWGSWLGVFLNFVCLIAVFYTALYPLGGSPNAEYFFENYLALPLIIFLYAIWKIYSWFKYPTHRPLWVGIDDIDIYEGMREGQLAHISGEGVSAEQRRASIIEIQEERKKKWYDYPKSVLTTLF